MYIHTYILTYIPAATYLLSRASHEEWTCSHKKEKVLLQKWPPNSLMIQIHCDFPPLKNKNGYLVTKHI